MLWQTICDKKIERYEHFHICRQHKNSASWESKSCNKETETGLEKHRTDNKHKPKSIQHLNSFGTAL